MDLSSIIGVVSGIGFILGTILLGGSILMFVNVPSVLVVLGGTLAATMVAYPLSEFLRVFRTEEEMTNMKIIFEGSLSIREGEHPKLMEDKLNVYLADAKKKEQE